MKVIILFLSLITLITGGIVKRQFNQFPGFDQFQPAVTQAPVGASTTTTLSPQTLDCIRLCPKIYQYNPICGSNGVAYDNQSHLNCARKCGINVQFVRMGTCRT
uniref:CSON001626 protein n=1 Tax=Culicoides sonorensis TaxID=179676 RepID=A0A336KWY9_CULSO